MDKNIEKKNCICCKKISSKDICSECRHFLNNFKKKFKQPIDINLINKIIRFRNPENVIEYIKSLGTSIKEESQELLKLRICPLCQKPHKMRTQLCSTCNKQKISLEKKSGRRYSVSTLLYVKQKYKLNTDEVFSFLVDNSFIIDLGNHELRQKNKRVYMDTLYSSAYLDFEKEINDIPEYILNFFNKNKDKELLYIDKQRSNPLVVYQCCKCGREIAVHWNDILKGHNCEKIKSSGEVIVEKYLKQLFDIKVQRDTLPCINPLTKYIMPYDIEIPSKKIIIEIQGEQHLKFIPYFHISKENFHYQKYKDKIKKEYAESCGYKVIYLFYEDIKSDKYKKILSNYLSE